MPINSRTKIKEANDQQLNERLRVLTSSSGLDKNPIDDLIDKNPDTVDADDIPINKNEPSSAKELTSLQNRFGVSKINRPVKDAQLTARIDSKTLKRFKDIVKQMYYPDKPNINETVTQIIRAFVEEYDKHAKERDDAGK